MKKFFRNLKTLAMCAVVGVAALAVSCSQPYDDTQIKADIEDLKTRVEALEIKLGNEVKALKDLIDAKAAELNDAIDAVEDKIAILDYTANADGSYTLTTKDGEEITIYPEFTENNEGLLTVQADERGNYYWAQIVNGVPVAITDGDGNKYYAHHATVVPEIPEATQVRQDENGANEVSFDGGKTWHKLGGGGDLGLFQSVKVSEDGKSITFVLNSGESFTTSLPEVFKFSVNSGKLFMKPAETAQVGLTLTSISDVAVIAKPEGWKADVNGNKLNIVAPAEEALTTAEESGYVKVLAITGENKAVFGKLIVSVGKGYGIAVEDGNIVVTNEMVMELNDYGMIYTVHPMLAYGFMPKPEGDVAEYLANVGIGGMYSDYMYFYANDYNYNPVDPENPVITTVVSGDDYGFVFEPGVEYIVWVTTFAQGTGYWDPWVIKAEDIVYTEYCQREFAVEKVSATPFDIQIDVINGGYDGYQVYFAEADYADGEWEFSMWQKGSQGYFGFPVWSKDGFEGSLFDFGYDPEYSWEQITGMPGMSYYLAVLPLVEGKPTTDYTFEDALVYYFDTAEPMAGGTLKVEIEAEEIGYTNVKGNFTADAGTKFVYYNYYREAAWQEEMATWSNEKWAAALFTGGYTRNNTLNFTYNCSPLNQGETIRFAAVAVDADGKYGEVTVKEFTSKVFTFSETLKVEATAECKDKTATISVATTAGTAVKYRYGSTNSEYTWDSVYGGTVEKAGQYLATTTSTYYYKEITAEDLAAADGKIVLSDLYYNSLYHVVIMAVDAEGNFSQPVGVEFTPKMDVGFLYAADEENPADEGYEIGMPSYELVSCEMTYEDKENPSWTCYTVDVKFTPSADAAKTFVSVMDESYEGTYPTPFAMMQYIVSNHYPTYPDYYIAYGYSMLIDQEKTFTVVDDNMIYNSRYIYITWCTEDENGYQTYRQSLKVNVRELAGLEMLPEEEEEEW